LDWITPAPAEKEVVVDNVNEMTDIKTRINLDLQEATSSLAEKIAHSEPFVHFREATRKMEADQEAMHLLNEYTDMQRKIKAQHDSTTVEDIDYDWLRAMQSAIAANDTIQEQNNVQVKASTFLQEVNQEISNLLGMDFASLTRRSGGCC
jgi:cell fate (sporulation/competence/biofilm development) regulator YlbF (YheA/YmcA/DUF963 family)